MACGGETQCSSSRLLQEKQIHETVVLRRKGVTTIVSIQVWSPEKMGDSRPKTHFNTSVQAGVFIRKEKESRTKI